MVTKHNNALISLMGIKKVFFTEEMETRALADINLSICRGEYISISGPSGCGKSTLLSILGLLDSPTEGQYYLSDQDVSTISTVDRATIRNRDIGFIFQSFNLIGDLSVWENVELPLAYRGIKPSERRQRVKVALEKVRMSHRKNHLPNQLSGGQQQRVAIARAVVGEPSLLLADEPTGNLDSRNGEEVMNMLKELHDDGCTLCMVTHNDAYNSYADRVIHLYDGTIVDDVSPGRPREFELSGMPM